MQPLIQFTKDHPYIFSLLIWPFITAFITGVFGMLGHLSDDDYAKLPKPAALFLHFLAASGLDAPKVLQIIASAFNAMASKGGGGTVAAFLLVFSLGVTVVRGDVAQNDAPQTTMALIACKQPVPPVNPVVTQGILTAEQVVCVLGASILGASTPAEFSKMCPALPLITSDVLAAINAVIDAWNAFMATIPPDGLDAGAPDSGVAMKRVMLKPLSHVMLLDGGK